MHGPKKHNFSFLFFTKRIGDDLFCGGVGRKWEVKFFLDFFLKGLVYRLSRDFRFDIDRDVYF